MKGLLRWLLGWLYGFRAYNEQALNTRGPVLLLPNHVSWWDWLLVGICLEEDWRFVTSSTAAETSWLHRKIMVNRRTFPVDMNSPYAVKHMAEHLQRGGRLVLFPEGRISCTGSLMKLFDGTGFLIHKTHAKVVTAYLRGAKRLPLSRNPNRKLWFPRLSVHFSEVLVPPPTANRSATAARATLTDWLRERMLAQQFRTEMEFGEPSIPAEITKAARLSPSRMVVQDFTLKELSYRRLFAGAELLAQEWRERFGNVGERVGILLPNVNSFPVVLLSLWNAGKVPAVLNYTTGAGTMLACCRVAGLRQVLTSESFVTRSKINLESLRAAGIKVHFLEEIGPGIGRTRKLGALFRQWLSPGLRSAPARPDAAALVLFTSGSEGEPKAVELSHRNILANIRQVDVVIDLLESDRFFNAMPLFHSFGLTVGLLLPLARGLFTFLYLSPLHYRVVPSALYNLNCTVFFGTNTFLSGYARKAHPYDFRSLRYLIAGAEKLQESTARAWCQRFGVRLLEGYGATECSPCIASNVPLEPCPGSVGKFLPGIEYRLEPVEGVQDPSGNAGRLLVRGPNVMLGYLNPEANARFKALEGWYDTGDIVSVDAHGFIHILGRLKRFAKVSGEMVSLTAVEEALAGAFPQFGLRFVAAVLARADEARGQKLMAVTNEPRLTLEQVREAVRTRGLGNLAVPRELKLVPEIPRLGTGKVNYRELEKLV
jgi:acyl-[acyl-carrier-protein]-phospholipid O-acyltransferase / long-chain-fatty-acid--[acyl-carrier-protein] ligase